MIENEEWRLTPYNGYWVSSKGRVRGKSGRIMRGSSTQRHPNSPFYVRVKIRTPERQILVFVHRLVCQAFHGDPPTLKHEVAHRNGLGIDNRAENLRWATPKENFADKVGHGKYVAPPNGKGENAAIAKLTTDQVLDIRRELETFKFGDLARLARQHQVTSVTIGDIYHRRTWKHI